LIIHIAPPPHVGMPPTLLLAPALTTFEKTNSQPPHLGD
jgi:hypothetical protein